MYYFSIQLLYASAVGSVAWLLTLVRGASATTKYWIWVVAAFNFFVPVGAFIDKVWALHLTWAHPLGVIGGPVWEMTQGRIAVVLAVIWLAGAFAMLLRLVSRIRSEHGAAQVPARPTDCAMSSDFTAGGIPVSFVEAHQSPSVHGVLSPCILLPAGLQQLLTQREFDAVLLHELAHARRRDNLIRLIFEVSLCVLWFHPLVWLTGAQMALYRELSCDESVTRRAHGQALVSALAKLAVPRQALFFEATATSHLSYRLSRLAGPAPTTHRAVNLGLISLFAAVLGFGIFQTIAHTACCFLLKH
jgi:beta-lactamase regulating signal transducer with metallopeptidase domain